MSNYYGDKYGLDEVAASQRKRSSARRGRRYKKEEKNNKPVVVAAVVLVVVLVATIGISMFIHKDKSFRFSKNVTVSGIDISGLSYDEAQNKLQNEAMSVIDDYSITVKVNDTTKVYSKKDFEYKFDYKSALEDAKVYSLIKQGKKEGELTDSAFSLNSSIKEKSIENLVENLAKEVDKEAVNAKVKEFKPFAENRFVYQKEQKGYLLVQAELVKEINDFFKSNKKSVTINALGNSFEPEVTVEDLKKNIVGLSKATSTSYNTENGNTNMRVALEACNGSVIEPGELWSFNECTGDSNLEENGYKSATVISGQKLAQGIGGGLCQASTTIFKAAIFANMSIYQRHNHFWASAYAYPGEDATIDYPNLDLKLRNTTEYQMFMECKMEGNILTVNIYGYQDPSYDNVFIYSRNHDIKKGANYKTTTYRYLYLDGEIVKEETLCNSTYSLTENYSVKGSDRGTFRTMVDGTCIRESKLPDIEEDEKPTEKPTEKKDKKPKPTESTEKPTKPTKPTSFTESPTQQETQETTSTIQETEPSEVQ